MAESYQAIEDWIDQAFEALRTRKTAKRNAIAREFRVPVQRLRSMAGHPKVKYEDFISDVSNLIRRWPCMIIWRNWMNWAYQLDYTWWNRLQISIFVRDVILKILHLQSPCIGPNDGLNRQPDLFKVKRKPLPVARKNAHDLDVLTTHFRRNFWVITQ